MLTDPIEIRPLDPRHFEPLYELFDAVCRERRFLLFTEAGPRSDSMAWYQRIVDQGHAHVVATRGEEILGWCDVLPLAGQMRQHAGTLGMAVASSARGQGIGRRLIQAAIAGAEARGLTRIELTVHGENHVAQALYRSAGFEQEGTHRGAWCLDGRAYDVLSMARTSAPALSA